MDRDLTMGRDPCRYPMTAEGNVGERVQNVHSLGTMTQSATSACGPRSRYVDSAM